MQVGKRGNSLAVRLPVAVVEGFDPREGDEIEIEIASERRFRIDRDRTRNDALARLRSLNWTLPSGFRLNRNEANER